MAALIPAPSLAKRVFALLFGDEARCIGWVELGNLVDDVTVMTELIFRKGFKHRDQGLGLSNAFELFGGGESFVTGDTLAT